MVTKDGNIGRRAIVEFGERFSYVSVGRINQAAPRPLFCHISFGYMRSQPLQIISLASMGKGTRSLIQITELAELPITLPPLDTDTFADVAEIPTSSSHHRAHLAKLDALFAALQPLRVRSS